MRDSVAVKVEADFFTTSVLGLFVLLRAKAPTTVIINAVHSAIKHLEGLIRDQVEEG